MRNSLSALAFGFLGAMAFHFIQIRFFSQANAGTEPVIRASRIDLIDANGRLRAQLGFAKEGPPGFWIMDEKGTARIAMGLYPDGTSHFGLQDKSGQMIQLMRSIGGQESPLLIFKNRGQDRMILGLNGSEIEPFFISYGKDGKKKVQSGFADGP